MDRLPKQASLTDAAGACKNVDDMRESPCVELISLPNSNLVPFSVDTLPEAGPQLFVDLHGNLFKSSERTT